MIARIKAEVFSVRSAVLAVVQCSIRPSILPRDNQEGCCSEEGPQFGGAGFRPFGDPRIDNNAVFSCPFGPNRVVSIHRNHIGSVIVSPPLSDGWQFGQRPNRPSPQRFLISSGKSNQLLDSTHR